MIRIDLDVSVHFILRTQITFQITCFTDLSRWDKLREETLLQLRVPRACQSGRVHPGVEGRRRRGR
jgi:hypothetical protein